MVLANKQIIVGITGGIAAYKSADLVRRLREVGAEVRVVMTEKAKEFITPLTMQAVSGNPVHQNLFDLGAEAAMGHIELARWADAVIVAPSSADFISRLLNGSAEDLLTTLCLATNAVIVLAPAMNQGMWKNTFTQDNAKILQEKGIHIFGPGEGSLACGDEGPGRMLESAEIVERLNRIFKTGLLSGKRVLVTAGPTQEPIDPIRYISNNSSGKMGYAMARAALEAGAQVTLISGPVNLQKPNRVKCIDVITAQEMFNATISEIEKHDIFISVAAVSDYRSKNVATQKIAKESETLDLQLERTPDIVTSVAMLSHRPFIVGFAAETEDLINKAQAKMKKKKLDMIIANQVMQGLGVGSDENAVVALYGDEQKEFTLMPKTKLARELIKLISLNMQG